MPLQYVTAFMLVAVDEGLGVTEYARRADVSQSVMTRHLLDLGASNRHHEAGYGLVQQKPDPLDRRTTRTMLTVKGRALAAKVAHAL